MIFRFVRLFVVLLAAAGLLSACNQDGPGVIDRVVAAFDGDLSAAGANVNAPAAPSGLILTVISPNQINLTWTDNSSNETGFKVYRRVGANAWVLIVTTAPNATAYQSLGLKPGKTYGYKITAYNSSGKANSAIVTALTPALLPIAAPTNLVVNATSATSAGFTWTDAANNELGYKVERKTGAGGTWANAVALESGFLPPGTQSYSNSDLAPQTQYYYRVYAFNSAGNSGYSNEANATTPADTTAPSAPVLTATPSGANINLSWTASTDNYLIPTYEVYRDETRITTTGVLVYNDTAVPSPAINYCYTVVAKDSAGNTATSNELCRFTNGTSSIFTIANTHGAEMGMSGAWDGLDYLIGIGGSTVADSDITAQLLNQRARKPAPLLRTGGSGGVPVPAWNGSVYLEMWPDDGMTPTMGLKAQLVAAAGDTIGNPFVVTADADDRGMVAGGGKFLVYYTVVEPATSQKRLYGRVISGAGVVGAPVELAGETVSTSSIGFQNAGFDGTNFLVTWTQLNVAGVFSGANVRGRLFSTALAPVGGAFTINGSSYISDDAISVGFGAGKYLVVYSDKIATGNTDLFGQMVTTGGTLSGSVITIVTAANNQAFPSVASDGSNFVVAWADRRNDQNTDDVCDGNEGTCMDDYYLRVNADGSLNGSEVNFSGLPGFEFGGVMYGGGKYLFLINSEMITVPSMAGGNVKARFMTP